MDVADAHMSKLRVKDEIGIQCQKLFQDFLEEFKEDGEVKYLEAAKELVSPERSTLEISFEDIEKYNQVLSTSIIEEYYRIHPFLCQAVSNFVKDRGNLKKEKECYVSFTDVPTRHKVRELTTAKIGTLIRISGQVVRTHPVHPELVLGSFSCKDCNTVTKNVEQQFKYTNPTICRNPICSNRNSFELDVHNSVFVDFQKVRIQETQSELPRGCIPRSLEVILRAECVEMVQPGDRYDFTGTLIVVPDVGALRLPGTKAELGSRHKQGDPLVEGVRGLKSLGTRDLNYKICFLACSITSTSSRFGGTDGGMEEITQEMMKQQMSEVEWNKVYEMSRDKNLYRNLITSLFPSIHGNDEIKKGITLMLFGGVPKTTIEGTTLRGDINCCIVGDPSTAKSQFLKQIADFSPRAIYTSGKASSAAGLTAAVVRDEDTSDFVIEAGALMLADNGICCIDEFDKMDPKDQVAIHEAMEQQTISIAKAGVRATLNARTSIFAAANPIGGRYDRSKSLQQNVMLTAPIMSRFDLFFILVDESNEIIDTAIAKKIVDLHSNNVVTIESVYTRDEILRYINFAKHFKPTINSEAAEILIDSYTTLRQHEGGSSGKSTWRVTVRQLESLIRLAEALAKLECSDEVTTRHVQEAKKLLDKSIIRVEQPDIELGNEEIESEPAQIEMTDAPPLMATLNSLSSNDQRSAERTPSQNDDQSNELPKKKLMLSFEEYKNVSNILIVYMRNEEARMEREDGNKEGIRKSELVAWYLDQIQDQIDTEEELLVRKGFVEKIIDRLAYHDRVIIALTTSELQGKSVETEKDPVLVVHPNYVLDP